jgi:hypothetical protein
MALRRGFHKAAWKHQAVPPWRRSALYGWATAYNARLFEAGAVL